MITWWTVSLLASVFLAVYVYANQFLRLSSSVLMLYRGFGTAIVMLPFCILFYDKFSFIFYALCAVQGIGISFIDNRYFRSAKVFGADVTSFMQPLTLFLTFVIWMFFKPHLFVEYMESPLKSLLIVLSLLGVVVSVLMMRKVKVNKKAFLYLLPCILIGAYLDNNNKLALDSSQAAVMPTLIYYNMVSGLFAGLGTLIGFRGKLNKMKKAFEARIAIKGLFIIFSLSMLVFTKAYALMLTVNPAYVVAINYLAPLWIVLFNYGRNFVVEKQVPINIDFKVMSLMVTSVIVLILSTR